jgi:hypothetical protein
MVVTIDGSPVFNTAVALPATVLPAFTAGTGGSTDTHAVSNVVITYVGGGVSGSSAGLPPGMVIGSSTLTGSTAVTPGSWGTGTNWDDKIAWTNASGQALSTGTLKINGITNNPSMAGIYYARLTTYTDTGCTTEIDSGAVAFMMTSGVAVSTTVLAEMALNVSGYNAGSCNGAAVTTTGSTGTTMDFGATGSGIKRVAAQTVVVDTNAAYGYSLTVTSSTGLSDGLGHSVTPWTGTNAAPTAFPAAGVEALAYSTDHALSGAATRFQTNLWAGLSSTAGEVASSTGPAASDTTHVCFQLGVGSGTVAGRYSGPIVYTLVPSF